MFPGESLKKQLSPTLKDNLPELDDSVFVSEEQKAKYLSMVGTAQWFVTLGRFNIAIAISILSLYRVALCKGHLKCMKQLYSYVKHFPNAPVHI